MVAIPECGEVTCNLVSPLNPPSLRHSESNSETPRASIFSSVGSDTPSFDDMPCLRIYSADRLALVTAVKVLTPTLDLTR